MFYTVPVTEKLPDFGRITALYERAFPANERRPLHPLLNDTTGCSDFLAFYEDKEFVGFACLLTRRDITHILYIAIDEVMRGQGYGTKGCVRVSGSLPIWRTTRARRKAGRGIRGSSFMSAAATGKPGWNIPGGARIISSFRRAGRSRWRNFFCSGIISSMRTRRFPNFRKRQGLRRRRKLCRRPILFWIYWAMMRVSRSLRTCFPLPDTAAPTQLGQPFSQGHSLSRSSASRKSVFSIS